MEYQNDYCYIRLRSQCSINCFISFATCLKVGASFTISSVIPCTSLEPFGIGICGLINFLFTCRFHQDRTFTIAISTIRSIEKLVPVVSRSIQAKGVLIVNSLCKFRVVLNYLFEDVYKLMISD